MTSTPKAPSAGNPFSVPAQRRTLPIETTPHLTFNAPTGDIIITVEMITPEIAKAWLDEYNNHNRKLMSVRADAHARDMAADNWLFIGDTIRFSTDTSGLPLLIDGQHRLEGIAKSGIAQTYIVVRGLPLDAQEVIDTGKFRSFSDSLKLEGWSNEYHAAAVIRRLLLWDSRVVPGIRAGGGGTNKASVAGSNPTKAELLAFGNKRRADVEESMKVVKAMSTKVITAPPAVVAAAWILLADVDRTGADLFIFEHLIGGKYLDRDDHPAKALRDRLTRSDRWKPTPGEAFMMILKAWNHWRLGEWVERIIPPRNGGWDPANVVIR